MLRGTAIVSLLTLLSRLLGFVRDLLIGVAYGDGVHAQAYLAAFRVPNLLRSVFAEGALTSAFVPTFSTELKKGDPEAARALEEIAGALLAATVVVTAAGVVFADRVVAVLAPGFADEPEKMRLCVTLTRVMMPYLIAVSLVALLNGALNAKKVFGAAAFAQVLMNLTLIAGAVPVFFLEDRRTGVLVLAGSVLAGGIVQVWSQLPALGRAGFRLRFSFALRSGPVRATAALMAPAMLGAGVYQITVFVGTVLVSYLESGSLAWLFYADRIVQLPVGVFSVALASVLLPTLSAAAAAGDDEAFEKNLSDALRFTSFVVIPVASLLAVTARPAVSLLFERGTFDARAASMTARAVAALAPGVWSASVHSMMVRAFVSCKRPRAPTAAGVVSLVSTVVLSLVLMGPVRPSAAGGDPIGRVLASVQSWLPEGPGLGHVGLAAASTCSSFVSAGVLLAVFPLLVRRVRYRAFMVSTVKASSAAALGALAAVSAAGAAGGGPLVQTAASSAAFAAGWIVVTGLTRPAEARELVRLLDRVRRKSVKV